jgi:hypothetical protein
MIVVERQATDRFELMCAALDDAFGQQVNKLFETLITTSRSGTPGDRETALGRFAMSLNHVVISYEGAMSAVEKLEDELLNAETPPGESPRRPS